METRTLGSQGLKVSAVGLGCMGMSFAYGGADEGEALGTLHRALELGCNFWDTAEVYGPYTNEQLLAKALKGRRDEVVVATKFGFDIAPETPERQGAARMVGLDSRPEHIRDVVHASLARLEIETIDLLYQHRVDPAVPIGAPGWPELAFWTASMASARIAPVRGLKTGGLTLREEDIEGTLGRQSGAQRP